MKLFGKKWIAPSGETWMCAQPFTRQIEWGLWGKDHYKELAALLQVPEELMRANTVIITIEARRNRSFGPFKTLREGNDG